MVLFQILFELRPKVKGRYKLRQEINAFVHRTSIQNYNAGCRYLFSICFFVCRSCNIRFIFKFFFLYICVKYELLPIFRSGVSRC